MQLGYGFSKYKYYCKPEKYNLVCTIEEMGFNHTAASGSST
uniref:Uncharacterized protein n=1 Tax=Arundo donax TaxID=35708 RepID=A0A0A9H147_ARUDO